MKRKLIAVKPLILPNNDFMGMNKYEIVLFDNCFQKEQLGYRYINGIKRYITGLDEFAPEVSSIKDEKLRREKIMYIRKEVADLEMKLIYNKIDVNDENFWAKVKKLLPTNEDFWGKIYIKLDNEGLVLDINNNVEHKILYHCIKAGGFTTIAPSKMIGLNNPSKYLFYLEDPNDDIIMTQSEKKLKNKAVSVLEDLEDNNEKEKLLYISKILLPNRLELSLNNSTIELYNMLDNFIYMNSNNSYNLQRFLDYSKKNIKELQVLAMLSDMIVMKKLYNNQPDNQYFCVYTQSYLGKTLEDCVTFLLAPANRITLQTIFSQYRADLQDYGSSYVGEMFVEEEKEVEEKSTNFVSVDNEASVKIDTEEVLDSIPKTKRK